MRWRYDYLLFKKSRKMSTNRAILDGMVNDFVDKISETFLHRKDYSSIS